MSGKDFPDWPVKALEEVDRLRTALAEKDKALEVALKALQDYKDLSDRDQQNAIAEVTFQLCEQRDAALKAWARELGEPYRAKTHEIDALVLTTRDRMATLGAANKRIGALEFALREARRSVNYEIQNTVSNSHQMDARRALVLVDEALEGKGP